MQLFIRNAMRKVYAVHNNNISTSEFVKVSQFMKSKTVKICLQFKKNVER